MARAPKKMHLTQAHVAAMVRDIPDPGPPDGFTPSSDADFAQYVADILAGSDGSGQVWIFAYGSLIWKPATDFVEIRTGLLRGWHRAFCLGWNTRHRGSDGAPGLMLALDAGGSCKGVLYRLPPDGVEDSLLRLVKREMGMKPSAFPPRWVQVGTERGPVRALRLLHRPAQRPLCGRPRRGAGGDRPRPGRRRRGSMVRVSVRYGAASRGHGHP